MTTRRPRDITDLADVIHELTNPRQHRQSYRAGWRHPNRTGAIIRDHITGQPSLLSELRAAITNRAGIHTGSAGRMTHTTLPRFSEDAFDRLEAIGAETHAWCVALNLPDFGAAAATRINTHLDHIKTLIGRSNGLTHPVTAALDVLRTAAAHTRSAVEINLHGILDRAGTLDAYAIDRLTEDAERWRTWCRIVTGWDTPALRPHVPCPHCGALAGEREGLRVRIDAASGAGGIVDDAAVQAAVCLTCNYTWDADTITLLADQLRGAGEELGGVA